MLILLLLNYTFNTVSTPIACHTLSNPAFTAHLGNYEFYLEHSDIGRISFFNLSARVKNYGFGFSSYFNELKEISEKRNWLGISGHFRLPVSIGCNFGLIKFNNDTKPLFDLGMWFRKNPNLGISIDNLLNIDRTIKIGISYEWRTFQGIFEIADSIYYETLVPHILLGLKQPISDFIFLPRIGYHPGHLLGGLEIQFRDFIGIALFFEESPKLSIGVNFSPPVIIHEVSTVETLTVVERPLVIKKIEKYKLSKKKLKYCEKHYLKGIEYYLDNKIEEAINEWKKVIAIYPEYKDVKRYMKNAREKLKLLKE